MILARRRLTQSSESRFALLRWQDIHVDGELYLRKFYLWRTPWQQTSLHWIYRPDPGRDHHDHPRDFVSFVLRGGYKEEILTSRIQRDIDDFGTEWVKFRPILVTPVVRRRLSWAYRRAEAAHRITAVSTCPVTLTFVLWGRHRRPWGFWTRGGWVDWRTYCGLPPRHGRGVRPSWRDRIRSWWP